MGESQEKDFILYRMVRPEKGLKLDQPRMLSAFYCTLIFILLIMDIVGVMFYLRTN